MGILNHIKISYLIPACLLLFSVSLTSQAALLPLTTGNPDFGIGSLVFTYDANCDGSFSGDCGAGQGKLQIDGFVNSYTEIGPTGSIVGTQVRDNNDAALGFGEFSLTAILDISGASVVSGNFFVNGRVIENFPFGFLNNGNGDPYNGYADPSGNLLNGDLGLMGFAGSTSPSSGGVLEFTYGNAGGLLADPAFPLLYMGGVEILGGGMILSLTTTDLAPGTFGTNFLTDDWTGTGLGDVFVPVPAAVWLFGSGLLALFGFARVKRNQQNS